MLLFFIRFKYYSILSYISKIIHNLILHEYLELPKFIAELNNKVGGSRKVTRKLSGCETETVVGAVFVDTLSVFRSLVLSIDSVIYTY